MSKTGSIKIMSVVGARPNFMKIAPIDHAISDYNRTELNPRIEHIIVHTGQHYDEEMSKLFFDDLEIPKPDVNLEVGSSSHAQQTAEIMKLFEHVLKEKVPDVLIVVGDVNSTIACTLVASKIVYPASGKHQPSSRHQPSATSYESGCRPLIAHVEAGLRSFDRSMPEEINRVLTDALSDILFITEESANKNLVREGILEEKIYFVGNVMIDTLLKHREKAEKSDILERLGLIYASTDNKPTSLASESVAGRQRTTNYCVLTLHRPSNVDEKETFQGILEALSVIAKDIPIIFPAHPRTLNRIHQFGFESYFDFSLPNPSPVKSITYFTGAQSGIRNKRIYCLDPLGYLDFLQLMANAKLVLTDSGGIQEETTILGVPCVTLRENTERPVTVRLGTNIVAGTNKENIIGSALSQLSEHKNRGKSKTPAFWDGNVGTRIVDVLLKNMA